MAPQQRASPVVETRGLTKHYPVSEGLVSSLLGRSKVIKAVDGVDLRIEPGEVLGVVGESGSGKSTLGEVILRLEEPTAGEIVFDGEDVGMYSGSELRQFRKRAQIIFQDPFGSLNPKKTVYQTVSEPLRNFHHLDREACRERVIEVLYDLGLRPPEEFLDAYPGTLSGGQRQRLNIARAIILEPDLLVADEPLSMLDASIKSGILKMLERLQEKYSFAILYISHDLSTVELVADRIAVMYRGEFVERGPSETILHQPKHPYTKALVSSLPDPTIDRERVLLPEDSSDETSLPSGCRFHPRCPEAIDVCSQKDPALAEADGTEVACVHYHDEFEN